MRIGIARTMRIAGERSFTLYQSFPGKGMPGMRRSSQPAPKNRSVRLRVQAQGSGECRLQSPAAMWGAMDAVRYTTQKNATMNVPAKISNMGPFLVSHPERPS